jgi:hypothetical protein
MAVTQLSNIILLIVIDFNRCPFAEKSGTSKVVVYKSNKVDQKVISVTN